MPSVVRIRVGVLGPAKLEVDGAEVRLMPRTTKLLVRLVAAGGEAVSVRQLYRDVWDIPSDRPYQTQRSRNEVQKRIFEIRQAMNPRRSDEAAGVLRTEQIFTGREPESAYRLVLERDQLDCTEFTELVNRAMHAAPALAAAMLTRALALWRGRPLAELGDAGFSRPLVRRLTGLYEAARSELVQIHTESGHLDLALPIAEKMAEERPDDPAAAERLRMLRKRLRTQRGDEILRREFPGLHVTVVVKRGDLFDQQDANLVIGFGDTFDTSTDKDVVISRESVQGQLVDRIFGGDIKPLNQGLRRGLRPVAPVGRESRQDKPKGKRVRYPIGTVVALPLEGRRVFAVAYSRQGNDLVSRSSPEELRLSLERLWASVASHGLLKPVAIPLVGSGLARVTELSREQLMIMIIDTFVRACRSHPAVTPELRIVIRPAELEKTRISDVERFVETLDQDGRGPHD